MDAGSRGPQWNSPKNQPKTSAAGGWQPQPMAATTAASYRPMVQPMGQGMPGQAMMGGQQPMMAAAPMQYPMGGGMQQQQPVMGSPKIATAQPTTQKQEVTFDPFGDL